MTTLHAAELRHRPVHHERPSRASRSAYAGRLLFSMGCHAGLDIDDAGGGGERDPGAGYGRLGQDLRRRRRTVGRQHRLRLRRHRRRRLFRQADGRVRRRRGPARSRSAKRSTEAKQQYAAGNAVLSPYDMKALMESTLYGLPMYTLNGANGSAASGSAASGSKAPVTGTDPITGLTEATVETSLPLGDGLGQLSEQTGADGTSYFQVNGTNALNGSTLTTEFRPIEPLEKIDVTEPSTANPGQLGLVAHGALVDSLSSQDITGFTPTVSQPDVDTAGPRPASAPPPSRALFNASPPTTTSLARSRALVSSNSSTS